VPDWEMPLVSPELPLVPVDVVVAVVGFEEDVVDGAGLVLTAAELALVSVVAAPVVVFVVLLLLPVPVSVVLLLFEFEVSDVLVSGGFGTSRVRRVDVPAVPLFVPVEIELVVAPLAVVGAGAIVAGAFAPGARAAPAVCPKAVADRASISVAAAKVAGLSRFMIVSRGGFLLGHGPGRKDPAPAGL